MTGAEIRKLAEQGGWLHYPDIDGWLVHCPACQPDRSGGYLAATVSDAGAVECREGCSSAVVAARLGLGPLIVTAREFIERPRPPVVPLVASKDRRTVCLTRGGTFGIAGPSGTGKSYAAYDLAGLLAGTGGDWLGLDVIGGQHVLLVPYPGENTEDDVAARLGELVPHAARDRVAVWDRWEGDDAPVADDAGTAQLAAVIAALEVDIAVLDTGSGFFAPHADGPSVSETAFVALEQARKLSGRPVAFVVILHTRKKDRRAETPASEVEEIGGTIVKKLDAAIVIRSFDRDEDPRRTVRFAKARRGPLPTPVIASFPRDPDAPPRLSVVERAEDDGTPAKSREVDAATIRAWIIEQEGPQAVSAIREHFKLSETTMRRRGRELGPGLLKDRVPGRGRPMAFGTVEQWRRLRGDGWTPPATSPATDSGGYSDGGCETPVPSDDPHPPNGSTRHTRHPEVAGEETSVTAGDSDYPPPATPYKGDGPAGAGRPSGGYSLNGPRSAIFDEDWGEA